MKKILLTLLITSSIFYQCFACWFSQQNINNAYIAGVNFFKLHYDENSVTNNIETIKFYNDLSVSLPLTIWFKVSPRKYFVNGVEKQANIRIAKLYYKVIPLINGEYNYSNENYKWRLLQTLNMQGKTWRLDFSSPVKLFGSNVLTIDKIIQNGDTIKSGDKIIFAWYFADDSDSCITNAKQIQQNTHVPIMIVNNQTNSGSNVFGQEYDYRAAYVVSVIYNGQKTINR